MTDPFGTAALRAALLNAWRESPTRLREDAALEADLVRAGYRDRLFTELAQNAADAARHGGVDGAVLAWLDGRELHVANTGAPLTAEGVQALSAMRASGKGGAGTVGRFGVGFTAVLACGDEIEIRSRSGSICFSARRTRAELGAAAAVPVLRLVWPTENRPRDGYATEVVVTLRDDVDAAALLAGMRAEAVDLLLELPALHRITVDATILERERSAIGPALTQVRIGALTWWEHGAQGRRLLVPVHDGAVQPVVADVLRAPTRSDESLSLPALLVCDVPMQPDRRRILPGAHVGELVSGYGAFVAALPESERPKLVPVAGLPLGDVDAAVREAVLAELGDTAWVPVVDGAPVRPARAAVFPGLTPDLAVLLADVVAGLVVPELSSIATASVLARVDVHRLGLARIAELLAGVDRSPQWWGDLYDALDPLVVGSVAQEELGALPVPLADGRTVTGPRTVVAGIDIDVAVPVDWARLIHPLADRPLLHRLGARAVGAVDLLDDPALRVAIEDVTDDDASHLAGIVLALAARVCDTAETPEWLGGLLLPDESGDLRHADELLLPDAPLARLLVDESPFGTVDTALVAEFGERALRGVGVGATFTVVRDPTPTGPDHALDDEDRWWDGLLDEPATLAAVRDLDLVDPSKWPAAVAMLIADPAIAPQFGDRSGYLPWWLRRHARIDGQPLGALRHPADTRLTGLLDAFEHPAADAVRTCLADPAHVDLDLAATLLERLADPARMPAPAVVATAHGLLAAAVAAGRIEVDDLDLPSHVRSMAGTVVDPGDAMVLDRPWLAFALPPERVVAGRLDTAPALAALLDLPLASDVVTGVVEGDGRPSEWGREPGLVLAALAAGIELPTGTLVVHDVVCVRLAGAVSGTVRVPVWTDESGATHASASFA